MGTSDTSESKCHHVGKYVITGCTGSCQNDNFQCSQCWQFYHHDNSSLSVYKTLVFFTLWWHDLCMMLSSHLAEQNHKIIYLSIFSGVWYLHKGHAGVHGCHFICQMAGILPGKYAVADKHLQIHGPWGKWLITVGFCRNCLDGKIHFLLTHHGGEKMWSTSLKAGTHRCVSARKT